jgi:uncharacterized UBP type Zn finger protein
MSECSICGMEERFTNAITNCSNIECNEKVCDSCALYIDYKCIKCNSVIDRININSEPLLSDEVEFKEDDSNIKYTIESSSELESDYSTLNDDYSTLTIDEVKDVKVEEIEDKDKEIVEINNTDILNSFNQMSILERVKKNFPILCPNLGNSCYINSTLQLIFNSYNLYYEFEETFGKFENIIDLVKLVREKYCSELKINIFEQGDSSSFLEWILDKINTTIIPNKANPSYSLLLHSIVVCDNIECKNVINQRQFYNILYVTPNETDNLLTQSINREFKKSKVEYNCSKCKNKSSVKKTYLTSIPSMIFISLQHFGSSVDFKIETDISMNGFNFKLTGFVERIGMMEQMGHYVSFILKENNSKEEKWLLLNDDRLFVCEDKFIEQKLIQNNRGLFQIYLLRYDICD